MMQEVCLSLYDVARMQNHPARHPTNKALHNRGSFREVLGAQTLFRKAAPAMQSPSPGLIIRIAEASTQLKPCPSVVHGRRSHVPECWVLTYSSILNSRPWGEGKVSTTSCWQRSTPTAPDFEHYKAGLRGLG